MDIKDARRRKEELRHQIQDLLDSFSKETGLAVVDMKFDTFGVNGGQRAYTIDFEVTL